jgi:uncharacterized protein (TIGR02266 family)
MARNYEFEDEAPTSPQHPLAPARILVEVEVTVMSESQFFSGITGDVSTGGIFVQTYRRFPIGTRLDVCLSLPTGEVEACGVVQWSRDSGSGMSPGVGIALEELTPSGRAQVEEFCRMRAPLYHESGIN